MVCLTQSIVGFVWMSRVEFARRRRGISRKDLAQSTGISPRRLRELIKPDNGEFPNVEETAALARVLDFPELFFHKGDIDDALTCSRKEWLRGYAT